MRSFAICLVLTPWLFSCGSSGSSALAETPTAIQISPEGFGLQGVCGVRGSGADLLSYVATLVDLTNPKEEKIVAPPTPCDQAVLFTNVNSGSRTEGPHRYVADLIAFDRDDVEARTVNRRVTGYRADGKSIEPRWEGSCGRLDWDEAIQALPVEADDEEVTPTEDIPTITDAGSSDAGGVDVATLDAGTPSTGEGPESLPLLPEYVPDSGFYNTYWGPQYAVSRRTVTLRGCYLLEISP